MWKTICREIWCSRSVTNAVVRKKVLREKTTPYGRRAMKTTDFSLSLSLSPSLCFSFTLSFHLSKAHVPDVSTSRVFAAEIQSEVGKEAEQRRASFELAPKGGIISFLHGRLRFGRHYMIVRFDEEITRNSHVSGWGRSRKSKHLGRGRWKISGWNGSYGVQLIRW